MPTNLYRSMTWFDGWDQLGRVTLSAVFVYAFLLFSVRLVGKRTTSKMNNYDWVMTVAVGAIAGATILQRSVVFLEGMLALSTLMVLQFWRHLVLLAVAAGRADFLRRAYDALLPGALYRKPSICVASERITQAPRWRRRPGSAG